MKFQVQTNKFVGTFVYIYDKVNLQQVERRANVNKSLGCEDDKEIMNNVSYFDMFVSFMNIHKRCINTKALN